MKRITDKRNWDKVLLEIGNFDIYHTYDYHRTHATIDGGTPVMFVIKDVKGIVALPILERKINSKQLDATSVYGYPGPISNVQNKSIFQERYIDLLRRIYSETGYISIFSRTNSLTLSDEILSKICHNSGETVVIELNCSEEEQLKKYRANLRRDISKLKRSGFECKFVDPKLHLDSFINIYESTMKSLGATDYYLFSEDYYSSLFDNSMAQVKLVECLIDGDVACSGIFFFCNNIVQYHLGGTSSEFYKFGPSKLMLDFIRGYAFDNQYDFFHLGGGLGRKNDNLLNFKKGFSDRVYNFYLMKEVLYKGEYDRLSEGKHESGYFPLYRAKVC